MINCDVVIPISRIDKYLSRTVKSVRRSKGVHIRIIFVNNRPQIKEFKDHINKFKDAEDIYIEEANWGYAQAMNAFIKSGVQMAPYITTVNSDDLIHKEKIIKQITSMEDNFRDASITELKKFIFLIPIPNRYGKLNYFFWNRSALILGAYGADSTILMKNKLFKKLGLRREDLHPDLVDFEYMLRLIKLTDLDVIPNALYKYRQHKNQISKTRAQFKDYLLIKDQVLDFIKDLNLNHFSFEEFILCTPSKELPSKMTSKQIETAYENIYRKLSDSSLWNAHEKILKDFIKLRKLARMKKNSIYTASIICKLHTKKSLFVLYRYFKL